uniref:RING-type E3 ubiquitin transferase n=1 Tax=Eptatretus burgeri TaxID=7764 RepID=A0A8C4R5R9_EPTBU
SPRGTNWMVPPMMDESSLLDLLECPVCLERLDATAKVLPCQHTFCKRCLQSIVTSRQGELRCPECRYLVRCAVEDLPANILLLRLLDGITRGQGPPRVVRVARAAAAAAAAVGAASSSSSSSSSTSPGFPTLPCARALYSYEGKDPGDLAFTKGDLIILRRRVDESWYQGETSSRQGFFPASYVQVCGRAVPAPQCRALYDFSVSGGEQDKDCLTFVKDEVLTVIRRVDENWAEGMLGDKIGIFPISFVEFNVTAKQMLGLDSAAGMGLTSVESTALAVASTAQGGGTAGTGDCRKNAKKRHSFTSLPMASKLSQHALQHRHSCDISAPVLVSSSNPAAAARIASSNGQPLSTPSQPVSSSGSAVSTHLPVMAIVSSRGLPAVYVALYPYKPQKADELELRKGEMYRVLERCQDGWYKGASLRTGVAGVFPGNYVMPVNRCVPEAQRCCLFSYSLLSTVFFCPHKCGHQYPCTFLPVTCHKSTRAPIAIYVGVLVGPMATVPPIQPQSGSPRAPHPAPRPMVSQPLVPPYAGPCTSPAYRATPSLSALASVASAITPPNVTATSLDEASGLASATAPGVSAPSFVPSTNKSLRLRLIDVILTLTSVLSFFFNPFCCLYDCDLVFLGYNEPQKAPSDNTVTSAFRYRAVVPYPPQSEAELELREGDVVFVHRKRDDGWFKGTLQRSGKTGLFPGSFVESF